MFLARATTAFLPPRSSSQQQQQQQQQQRVAAVGSAATKPSRPGDIGGADGAKHNAEESIDGELVDGALRLIAALAASGVPEAAVAVALAAPAVAAGEAAAAAVAVAVAAASRVCSTNCSDTMP